MEMNDDRILAILLRQSMINAAMIAARLSLIESNASKVSQVLTPREIIRMREVKELRNNGINPYTNDNLDHKPVHLSQATTTKTKKKDHKKIASGIRTAINNVKQENHEFNGLYPNRGKVVTMEKESTVSVPSSLIKVGDRLVFDSSIQVEHVIKCEVCQKPLDNMSAIHGTMKRWTNKLNLKTLKLQAIHKKVVVCESHVSSLYSPNGVPMIDHSYSEG